MNLELNSIRLLLTGFWCPCLKSKLLWLLIPFPFPSSERSTSGLAQIFSQLSANIVTISPQFCEALIPFLLKKEFWTATCCNSLLIFFNITSFVCRQLICNESFHHQPLYFICSPCFHYYLFCLLLCWLSCFDFFLFV